MPNRVIREGLLDSQRYWSVSIDARQLFVHIMLLADDFGCVSLAPVFLRRRCFAVPPSDRKLSALLAQLKSADLIRPYERNGAKYAFIPRYGQRLKRETLRHPKPPDSLFADDDEAREKFKRIKDDSQKSAARGRRKAPEGGPPAAEVKRSEGKRRERKLNRIAHVDPHAEPSGAADTASADNPSFSEGQKGKNHTAEIEAQAAEYGLVREPRETDNELAARTLRAMVSRSSDSHRPA